MSERYDAIIIGAGQAGPPLALRLAGQGLTTALIERRQVGGSCVNFGCTPTKAMVASARAAWAARRAGELGVRIGGSIDVDLAAVKARTDAIVASSRDGLREALSSQDHIALIEAHARFTGTRTVSAGGRELSAPRIFINTGTRSAVPPIPGLEASGYWTPSSVSRAETLPEHLIVLGGGATGVEYAQMFGRFGSRVTLIERHARLLPGEDSDVSAAVQRILESEGIDVQVGAEAKQVQGSAGDIALRFSAGGSEQTVQGDRLLLALGRRPNSDDLDLEAAGVAVDADGHIPVDEILRTGVDGIWALGDVNGKGAFTHTAYDDYRIVADQLFGEGRRSLDDRIHAAAVYIDPPLGRVGLDETQIRAASRGTLLAKMPMSAVSRATERGETEGFMKVLVDEQSSRILGATVLGIGGDEVVQALLIAMAAGAPYQLIRDLTGIHPTVSELLPSLFASLERMESPVDAQAGEAARQQG
ncbi:MAG: mercuric reductase [Thiohalocapsa sp.]|nr:mercuric reductase [Thiohalocapsa sp.]